MELSEHGIVLSVEESGCLLAKVFLKREVSRAAPVPAPESQVWCILRPLAQPFQNLLMLEIITVGCRVLFSFSLREQYGQEPGIRIIPRF